MYQLMQLGPGPLRAQISAAHGRDKWQLISALVLRDIALLAFAIVYIASFTRIFGQANSSVAVSSFCMLLGIRFVDYGYRATDGILALVIIIGLLMFGSVMLPVLPPLGALAFNFGALLLILRLTTSKPEYGNGGLYTFGYIFITGMPVSGEQIPSRLFSLALTFVILSLVLLHNHHGKVSFMRLHHTFTQFALHDKVTRWHLRLATGVATTLFLAQLLHAPRPVWMGYAAMSVLLPMSTKLGKRAWLRISGVIVGAVSFALIFTYLPTPMHFLIGPIAGLGLGLTASYFWASILNCFGALMIANVLFGTQPAAILRIGENGFGLIVALICAGLLQLAWFLHGKHCAKTTTTSPDAY